MISPTNKVEDRLAKQQESLFAKDKRTLKQQLNRKSPNFTTNLKEEIQKFHAEDAKNNEARNQNNFKIKVQDYHQAKNGIDEGNNMIMNMTNSISHIQIQD